MPETGASEPLQREPGAAPPIGDLFVAFSRLGATAFGGPATVAYIRQMAVDQKGWLNARTFDDGVALCQAVPGATAMQTAAYVGLCVRGVCGAAASLVGFGLPAFVLMTVLSVIYARTHSLPAVVSVFSGLQAIVVAVVANAALSFGFNTLKEWRRVPITALAVGLFGWGINPFLVIVLSAFAGFWLLKEATSPAPAPAACAPMPHTIRSVILILLVAAALLAGLFHFHRQLFDLATMMLRIDLFAFGGGFASVPLLFNEVVTVRHWLDGPTLLDGIVLGQVTPGPIVITATFVGYLFQGLIGAVVATLAVFLPSFLVVIAAAPYFDRLRTSPVFAKLISGALCSFPGLLLIVTVNFGQSVNWDVPRVLLTAAAFIALRLGVNILWVVLVGAAFSYLFYH
jgi:chromate transporter